MTSARRELASIGRDRRSSYASFFAVASPLRAARASTSSRNLEGGPGVMFEGLNKTPGVSVSPTLPTPAPSRRSVQAWSKRPGRAGPPSRGPDGERTSDPGRPSGGPGMNSPVRIDGKSYGVRQVSEFACAPVDFPDTASSIVIRRGGVRRSQESRIVLLSRRKQGSYPDCELTQGGTPWPGFAYS